jgi:DNA-binding PadR family transcriptional regulator
VFADQTLTPKEALRLCALGTVAGAPMRYGALAGAVRNFCGRVMGPSLDLMGPSIELLRYEGLVEAREGKGMEDDALLAITEAGQRELKTLLAARVRPSSDLSKLVIALKFRFLHLLDAAEQTTQIEMLRDASESELARLEDLRESEAASGAALAAWLDHDLDLLRQRIGWLEAFTPDSSAAARSR